MNRKTAFFTGLSFGSFMSIFYILQPLIWRDGNEEMNWTKNIAVGLISGLVAGFLFGLIMYLFANSKWAKPKNGIRLHPGEVLLFETGANHLKGWQGVGGRLYLTSQRLVFISHRFNIQKHERVIPITDVDQVGRYKTTLFTNNGIFIITKTGTKEKFVVQQPNEWLEHLTTSQIGIANA